MPVQTDLDKIVGRIAGTIYSDIAGEIPGPPLLLIPAITFKVRKALEPVNDVRRLTKTQKEELAKDVQIAVIPMLFSYEIDPAIIEKIAHTIELAALKAIQID